MFKVKSQFELKDADEKTGIIICYPSVFNVVDSDRDMIVPGAYLKTINESGPGSAKPRIKHLWQHDRWQPIGIPTSMKEDSKGLLVESKIGNDSFSRDKLQQHIDGIITELSIGYEVIKSEKVMKTDQPDVFDYARLTELKLYEYSSVTWGANSLTEIVDVKGDRKTALEQLNLRMDKFIKALRNPKYTDESLEGFELEIKQIQTIINELLLKPEPDVKSTLEPGEKSTLIKEINQIIFNH